MDLRRYNTRKVRSSIWREKAYSCMYRQIKSMQPYVPADYKMTPDLRRTRK